MRCRSAYNAPADCVEIRIDITYDGYPLETSWQLFDSENQVIYDSKPHDVKVQGLVQTALRVRRGSYRLAVYDKGGDGLCCIYGQGNISVFTGTRNVQAGAIFGSETSTNFVASSNYAARMKSQTLVYGNNVALRLTINYDRFPKETSWKLMNDDTGLVVDEVTQGGHSTAGLWSKDYTNLRPGHYWFFIADSSFDGTAGGAIKIEQIDGITRSVMSEKWSDSGNFGSYVEGDFLVV